MGDKDSSDDEHAQWIDIKRLLKVIPRDNPDDPFKPHSWEAIQNLAKYPVGRQLSQDEEQMLQNVGADMDMCTTFDKTEPPGVSTSKISRESRAELLKLPAWLRSFLESKFDVIHNRYGYHTHIFLERLVKSLEYRKLRNWSLLPRSDIQPDVSSQRNEEESIGGPSLQDLDPDEERELIVIPEDNDPDLWSPLLMHRATDALRAVLLAGASDSEGEEPGQDEWDDNTEKISQMRNKRKSLFLHKEDKYQDFIYKGPHWEDVVAEKERFSERAKWEVGLDFTPIPEKKEYYMRDLVPLPKIEKKEQKNAAKAQKQKEKAKMKAEKVKRKSKANDKDSVKAKRNSKDQKETVETKEEIPRLKELRKKYYSNNPGHPLYKEPKEVVEKKAREFKERGVGKRPSRIYFKDPCAGPVTEVNRELHQVRPTEGIHAYVNFITSSGEFRAFIMIVIFFNAILLAAETGERRDQYQTIFDIFDSIFLSVYLVEFMLKCYSNPVQYFQSGFNIFDFCILILSLVKACIQWTSNQNILWLRFFVIVRALRILRGVSLSVHTQVLVTALVETLKNHVLSVIVLLILLMYIASIVAFYFFSDQPALHNTWGRIPNGMLRLFAFVTMDGWTEVLSEFEEAGWPHQGRAFCLICIVFGNFLFSNIFIAIIIMQISEATDSFRKIQTAERESSIFLKQEAVFRRQKLDMRQLLARQRTGASDDFYELGSRFVRRLRHDDLVDNRNIIFSPLWIDALYKGMQRGHHTSNLLMTLHRKMADRLVKLNNLYNEGKYTTRGISRGRYNRYLTMKAKLALIKESFLDMKGVPQNKIPKIRLPNIVEAEDHAGPPPRPPPMPPHRLWKAKASIAPIPEEDEEELTEN